MKRRIFFQFLLSMLGLFLYVPPGDATTALKEFDVKDFGASGDGRSDDTKAIQNCLDAALKAGGGKVLFPFGRYKITKEIKINLNKVPLLEIAGLGKNGSKPVIYSDQFINIFEVFNYYWSPAGELRVTGLDLRGNNKSYSKSHPYYNKWLFRSGIFVYNLKKVVISDNIIQNVYGMGIQVSYSNPTSNPDNRFDEVVITGNRILNCWGLQVSKNKNGVFDNYGDGIYISSVKKAIIKSNYIKNDLQTTRQFGRAGIVLEYNAENCLVEGNYIFGYDRNVHVEADIGGHVIKNNTLEGSDFGILIYAFPRFANKKITITGNTVSNKGLPKNMDLTRIRDSEERCLLSFYAKAGCREGSTVKDNRFIIYSDYAYKYNTIVRLLENSLELIDNKFIAALPVRSTKRPSKGFTFKFYYPINNMIGNSFENVGIEFNGKQKWPDAIKGSNKGNKLGNGIRSNIEIE